MEVDPSLTSTFDKGRVDEMDPSLAEGHRIIYDREVPFELRIQEAGQEPQEVGRLEAVKVKVLTLGDDSSPSYIKIELTSENDLLFYYVHAIDTEIFADMQTSQKLRIDFSEYSSVLMRMLNNCIKEPQSFLAVFIVQRDGQCRLDFIQNFEYKFIELLSCDFMAGKKEAVR